LNCRDLPTPGLAPGLLETHPASEFARELRTPLVSIQFDLCIQAPLN
jgi:hypothetical protein